VKQILLPTLRYRRTWVAFGLLLAAIITYFSLIPAQRLPSVGLSDKVEHMAAYVLLAFFFGALLPRRDYKFLFLALLAFGGAIEIAQGLMKLGREADLMDLVADVVGTVIGLLLVLTPLGLWPALLERWFAQARHP
jgi:VanZ family protein